MLNKICKPKFFVMALLLHMPSFKKYIYGLKNLLSSLVVEMKKNPNFFLIFLRVFYPCDLQR